MTTLTNHHRTPMDIVDSRLSHCYSLSYTPEGHNHLNNKEASFYETVIFQGGKKSCSPDYASQRTVVFFISWLL